MSKDTGQKQAELVQVLLEELAVSKVFSEDNKDQFK